MSISMSKTLRNILATRDACDRILYLAAGMDELEINDYINANRAASFLFQFEGIANHLEEDEG